jgi:hypothetical protein
MTEKSKDAERDARNIGLQEEAKRLRDTEDRTHGDIESDSTAPERPVKAPEEGEKDLAHLENPPQVEGPRERSNDAV